jgi:fermentation-respiration switch protein FrsA (DUF1100 family)
MLHTIKLDSGNLKRAQWHEYVIRFLLGGTITMAAGFIAEHWGPGAGGLFLAFPAILPASATLIAKHECEKKARKGMHGETRGRMAAALDTRGAALGSAGMLAFGAAGWWLLPRLPVIAALAIATAAWGTFAIGAWALRKRRRKRP